MQIGAIVPSTLLVMASTVVLTSFSQIVLKIGMSGAPIQKALLTEEPLTRVAWLVGTSPLVLLGLASYTVGALLWLFVLSKVDVSVAYPCMALGYVVTLLAGHFLLAEPISFQKMVGVTAIVLGVAILAGSR